jgi:hypothetical protein
MAHNSNAAKQNVGELPDADFGRSLVVRVRQLCKTRGMLMQRLAERWGKTVPPLMRVTFSSSRLKRLTDTCNPVRWQPVWSGR